METGSDMNEESDTTDFAPTLAEEFERLRSCILGRDNTFALRMQLRKDIAKILKHFVRSAPFPKFRVTTDGDRGVKVIWEDPDEIERLVGSAVIERNQQHVRAEAVSDQDRIDRLVEYLQTGEYNEAIAVADKLSGLCDNEGVLCRYPSLRELFEVVADMCGRLDHEVGDVATTPEKKPYEPPTIIETRDSWSPAEGNIDTARAIARKRNALENAK